MRVTVSCLLIGLLWTTVFFTIGCGETDRGKVTNTDNAKQVILADNKTREVDAGKGEKTRGTSKGTKRALLIGCTIYPHLEERHWLKGPGNDVILMRELLVKHFGFADENIVTLSEGAGKKDKKFLPEYAHIKREYQALAKAAQPGDQIVIVMAGHGSQVPESPTSKDPEPDGLDEIFLPRDVKKWGGDGDHARPENIIVDDELGDWLAAIQKTKANIWLVVDSCHSGTMIRGNERTRDLKPEDLGIGKTHISKAVATAAKRPVPAGKEKTRGLGDPQPMKLAKSGGLVAIYAAQAKEVTVERDMPDNAKDARPYGLLSYTIAQTLLKAKAAGTPISYRELIHRVQRQYDAWNRTYPTPVIEGDDQYREVLGDREFKKEFRLVIDKSDDGWKLNAGALQGITKDSILAVYSPDGKQDKPVGHVKVGDTRTLEADVSPCEYGKMAAVKDLPRGGLCKVVYADAGDQSLKIAVDLPAETTKKDAKLLKTVQDIVKKAAGKGNVFKAIDDPRKADWRLTTLNGKYLLVPSSGFSAQYDHKESDSFTGPLIADEEKMANWLQTSLNTIGRAANLIRLAASMSSETARGDDAQVNVKTELFLVTKWEKKGGKTVVLAREPIKIAPGLRLYKGDILQLKISNLGRSDADVTVLYVDSNYGINALWPPRKGQSNRIEKKKSIEHIIRPDTATTGLERMVVLAVPGVGTEADFRILQQKALDKGTRDKAGVAAAMQKPIGKLLDSALYGQGTKRGMASEEVEEVSLGLMSWHIMPTERPKK